MRQKIDKYLFYLRLSAVICVQKAVLYLMKNSHKPVMSHEVCTGCSCCLLSCPVWNRTKDRSLTAQGRNKALQGGATVEDISNAIDSCLLCGACEPNCPEGNDIVGLTIEQRRLLNMARKGYPSWYPATEAKPTKGVRLQYKGVTLLAGKALRDDKEGCEAVLKHLGKGSVLASDDGSDILRSIEAGLQVNKSRTDDFIYPLNSAGPLVLAEGGLRRHLKEWLPDKKIVGLGEALLSIDSIRRSLGPDDLYIIECRVYHSDYARLVRFYDRVRMDTGAQFNLDLQRIAIPTGTTSIQAYEDIEAAGCIEQLKWILYGRKVGRIIVETTADIEAFRRVTDIPVVHVALLA